MKSTEHTYKRAYREHRALESTSPAQARQRARPRRRTRPWVGRILLFIVSVAAAVCALAGVSLAQSLATPSTDDTPTRVAEWARDHGLGPIVTVAETVQLTLHPAIQGGTPDSGILAELASSRATTQGEFTRTTALHPAITPPVKPALPHEGTFVPARNDAAGALIQYTYVRPDSIHTSYLAGIAVMDHSSRFVLHPGTQEPGSSATWTEPSRITPHEEAGLLATFNGGFKLADAQGGYFDHGRSAGSLTQGAASLVIYNDGHATVGTWGDGVSMTSNVAFVRQNLLPLISHGVISNNLAEHVQANWGTTVGGSAAVWRSGLGVTSVGDLVYVSGDALTVQSLADLLYRAGAINAMQLDINQSWVSFMFYTGNADTLHPHKLGPFQRPVNRYMQTSTRDFIAVYGPR